MTVSPALSSIGVELSFEGTVPRTLVHKSAIEQVLLTDHRQIGESTFACAAQLPRAHSLFSDSAAPLYDPLLLLEVGRQAGLLVSHHYLGVPHSSQFVFSTLHVTLEDLELLRIGPTPTELVLVLEFSDPRHRRGELVGGAMDARLTVDGTEWLSTGGSLMYIAASRYEALRNHLRRAVESLETSDAQLEPAPSALVGRADLRNVVIARPESIAAGVVGTQLIVDQGHGTFFDHPYDHVPGALLLEGLRQTATAAARERLGGGPIVVERCEANYDSFAELDLPVMYRAVVRDGAPGAGRATVGVTIDQGGNELADGRFELVAWDAGR